MTISTEYTSTYYPSNCFYENSSGYVRYEEKENIVERLMGEFFIHDNIF